MISGALWLLFRFTRIGMEIRAVVDRRELAELSSIPANRVAGLSWALGCGLAGLTGVLLAPQFGLDPFHLTLLVIETFSIAVVARLVSLPLAAGAGVLLLGVLNSLLTEYHLVVLPVFGLILAGYLAGAFRVLGQGSTDALNRFVYYFALPPPSDPARLFVEVLRPPAAAELRCFVLAHACILPVLVRAGHDMDQNALATKGRRAKGPFGLTMQEMRVVELLPRGLTNVQIGKELGVSEQTVKSHLYSAMRKLRVSNRAQAAAFAQREGLA